MKKYFYGSTLTMILAFGSFYLVSKGPVVRRSAASIQDCPDTPEGWGAYFYMKLLAVKSPYDMRFLSYNMRSLWECESAKRHETVILACIAGFDRLEAVFKDDYAMGLEENGNNSEDEPVTLNLPQAFKDGELIETFSKASSSQKRLDEVIGKLMTKLPKDARTFQFDSVNASHRGLVTVIPGDDSDLFVHYHAEKPDSKSPAAYLVIRSEKKKNGEVQPLPRMEFYQPEFFRLNDKIYPEHGRCISCHRAGTIKIIPRPGSVKSHSPALQDSQVLNWFDKIRPKSADRSHYDFSHLGPEMGPDDPKFRTLDTVRECARIAKPDITNDEVKIVKRQMNCVGCHMIDGPGTDLLRFPIHARNFGFKIFDNIIRSGYMPKDPKTPEALRESLVTCLKSEFFGGFRDSSFSQGNPHPGILMRYFMSPECPFPNP